jgi:hypothetical protein
MGIGWIGEISGAGYEEFLAERGFVWPARLEGGLRLALFGTLWPWVPERMQREMIARSSQDGSLGKGANRCSLVDAYLAIAVAVWHGRRPRSLLRFWELHRLLESGERAVARDVYREARRLGLHLPVGMAAALASGLWGHEGSRQVAELLNELSHWERGAGALLRAMGPEAAVARGFYLSPLLSGRDLRGGWQHLEKALWAHPGLVADSTPGNWPWLLRRGRHLAARSLALVLGDLANELI